ncbi:uncharacterized protein LOC144694514 [Cetorhinus maximus]
MFTAGKWQRIKSGFRGPEDFYPLKHVSHKEWGRSFTLPDSALPSKDIDAPKEGERAEFPITNLIHVTDSNGVRGILDERCLKNARLKQIGEDLRLPFSWWSVRVDQEEVEREREVRRDAVETLLRQTIQDPPAQDVEMLLEQFVSSPAFLEVSNYGNFKFTYKINDLIGEYKKSICQGNDPEFRELGTFRYDNEIMHTVAVHPPGVEIFKECPPLPSPVISREGAEWKWEPESTGSKIRVLRQNGDGGWRVDDCSPDCRQWEFVSFAFYLPEEKPEFPVPLELKHLSVCEMEKSQRFRPPHTYMSLDEAKKFYAGL